MKRIVLIAAGICILLWGAPALGTEKEKAWSECHQKARHLQAEEKYAESLKAYEELLSLTQAAYGENHVKVSEVLIEMAILYRYDLNDEKKYDEFQERAKKIKLSLNGILKCREPQGWSYEPCRERWLGPDPCFIFTKGRSYIKVTYYGLEGSEFRTPEDFTAHLRGLFKTFEAMDTRTMGGRMSTRIKLRYERRNGSNRDGHYRMPEFLYDEFLLLPLKKGFLAFNLKLNHHAPVSVDLTRDGAQDADRAVRDEYKHWMSFTESCNLTK